MRIHFAFLASASLVFAVGCGSNASPTPPAQDMTMTTTGGDMTTPTGGDMATTTGGDMATSGTDGSTGPKTVMVQVGPNGSFSFSPSTTTISVGDTVTWTWASGGHTVTSGGNCIPDNKFCSQGAGNCASPTMTSASGATFSFTFTTAGTYPYYCAPHCAAGMKGTITVQ